jgi:hypothetical protein
MFPCFLFRLPGAIPHRETPVTYLACIKVFTLLFDVGFVTFLCFLFVSSFRQVFIWHQLLLTKIRMFDANIGMDSKISCFSCL